MSVSFYLDNSSHRPWTPAGVSEVPGCENQHVHQDQQSHQAHQLDVSNDLKAKINLLVLHITETLWFTAAGPKKGHSKCNLNKIEIFQIYIGKYCT